MSEGRPIHDRPEAEAAAESARPRLREVGIEPPSRQEILDEFPFYREGPADFRAEFEANASHVQLETGKHFCLEGEKFCGFALIGDGRLRVYKLARTGRQITLYQVGGGETCVIDMLCTVMDIPSPASAVAHTDVAAVVVPPELFRRWIRERELLRNYVFNTLASRLVGLMSLVEQVAFEKMDRRLAAFLLSSLGPGDPEARSLEMTHEAIAAELGSAREVISRLLEEFERRGGVALSRGRVTLTNPGVLQSITAESA